MAKASCGITAAKISLCLVNPVWPIERTIFHKTNHRTSPRRADHPDYGDSHEDHSIHRVGCRHAPHRHPFPCPGQCRFPPGSTPLLPCDHDRGQGEEHRRNGLAAGKFNTLIAAAKAAGLAGTLQGEGPFTVFAPTDEAFAKLPKGTVESLLKPENKDKLAAILKYHVVPGNVKLAKALEAGQGKTVLGPSLGIKFEDGRVKIGTANLVTADIAASNGTIHVIDSVLLPPAPPAEASGPAKARSWLNWRSNAACRCSTPANRGVQGGL